ncbi:peroxisomal membrane protein [Trichosporon asahii var. asahii CBS 8904]|uniref:Peroxisomal membrane protein n=1 Tax=Trichosporon asahii var. asahii (strain CBS 8904) TaxID=1220162 RepID=K1VQJ5_TRIAC|nr:peroxisomal membrane protein [Trichosporon asahii var. asahii CBS 8904]
MGDSAIHALAGGVGGGISMALTYPLVNLSTRAAVATKKSDMTLVQAIKKTIHDEGLSGLYAGLGSSLVGIVFSNSVYYERGLTPQAFYEETRSKILRRRPAGSTSSALTTGEGILAGLIAGTVTTLVTNPVWTVQAYQSTRGVTNESGKKEKPTASSALKAILKQDGIKGLWRGIGPALILVINPVIQYTTFERLVSAVLTWRAKRSGTTSVAGRGSLTDWDFFILGALSKLVATGVTYPYLVVKSRLQAATHKYKSSITAVIQILKTEGISGLYAGIGPKLLQSALTAAFMFVAQRRIFELVKSLVVAAQQKKAAALRA